MILRCVVDGLLLPAELAPNATALVAYDGDEGFSLEAIEAERFDELPVWWPTKPVRPGPSCSRSHS